MADHKIKVLLYNRGIDCGGIETFLFYLMEYFYMDKDLSISLLTRNGVKSSAVFQSMKNKKFDAVSLDIEHLNIKTAVKFRCRLRKYLKNRKFDILHLHGMDEPFVISESIKSGIKKIFIHVHSTEMIERNVSWFLKIEKDYIRRKNFAHADAVMAPSKEVISILKGAGIHKPAYWIANVIDIDQYRFSQKERVRYRDRLGIADDTFVIGHTGRFTDVKNHEFIIRIFKEFLKTKQNVKLVLAGEGPLKENIISQIISMKIEENVLLTGSRSDVSQLLNAFDVFLFPSKFEGLGISLVEAQCNGLPCLTSDTIPADGIVTDLVYRCSLKDSVQDWCRALRMIKTNVLREPYADIVKSKGYGLDAMKDGIRQIYLGKS